MRVAVLKGEDSDEIDEEAKDRHNEETLMLHLGGFNGSLQNIGLYSHTALYRHTAVYSRITLYNHISLYSHTTLYSHATLYSHTAL